MTVLGKRIRQERTGCGLSREELAKQLNVTTEELTAWEEGTGYPKFHICQKIMEILKIPREIILEDTMYRKVLHHMEPVLSSPKQKWTQILFFSLLMILQLFVAFLWLREGMGMGFILYVVAIIFYIAGIVLTIKGKMQPTSTGWFTGIPFLFTVFWHTIMLSRGSGYIGIFSVLAIFLISIGMIVVFYLKISSFVYYAVQILCYKAIVEGIVLLLVASYFLATAFAFFIPQAILLLALFRLQVEVYYKKRKWLD